MDGRGVGVCKVCPYLEQADARCAGHLTVENIFQAFADCVEQPGACSVYRELAADDNKREQVGTSREFLTVS